MTRYASRSMSRSMSSACAEAAGERRSPLTTEPFIWGDYSIRLGCVILDASMETNLGQLYRWDEIALEKVTEMLSRKIVTGEREMLVQVYVKRGCLVPMHAHESEQMVYVLQ